MCRIEQVEKRVYTELGRGGDTCSKLKKCLLEDAPMFLGPPPRAVNAPVWVSDPAPIVNAPVLTQRGRVRISARRKRFL